MKTKFIDELDSVITPYMDALNKSAHKDASDIFSDVEMNELATRCVAAVERASGRLSTYSQQIATLIKSRNDVAWAYIAEIIGVAKALQYDLRNDYISSFEEIAHESVFADYLEMADHFLGKGFKDAAAVITGSTLDAHIKQLCNKFSIPIDVNGKPKKADALNAELTKARIYTLLDQKSVTAWLGLRNEAAHGNYTAYSKEQVSLMLEGVRNFITRHPA